MTLQLSIDDHIIQEARKVAESMGTSIDQLVQDYLASMTIEAELEELKRLSKEAKGDSRGWKFNRDELYDL
jgi:replicative DNA helicase